MPSFDFATKITVSIGRPGYVEDDGMTGVGDDGQELLSVCVSTVSVVSVSLSNSSLICMVGHGRLSVTTMAKSWAGTGVSSCGQWSTYVSCLC